MSADRKFWTLIITVPEEIADEFARRANKLPGVSVEPIDDEQTLSKEIEASDQESNWHKEFAIEASRYLSALPGNLELYDLRRYTVDPSGLIFDELSDWDRFIRSRTLVEKIAFSHLISNIYLHLQGSVTLEQIRAAIKDSTIDNIASLGALRSS